MKQIGKTVLAAGLVLASATPALAITMPAKTSIVAVKTSTTGFAVVLDTAGECTAFADHFNISSGTANYDALLSTLLMAYATGKKVWLDYSCNASNNAVISYVRVFDN